MTLGDAIGHEGCLEVVEAEAALGAEALPVAVVVTVAASAAGIIADLPGKVTVDMASAKRGGEI